MHSPREVEISRVHECFFCIYLVVAFLKNLKGTPAGANPESQSRHKLSPSDTQDKGNLDNKDVAFTLTHLLTAQIDGG